MTPKSPQDWRPEDKFQAVLDAASLSNDDLGAFLRSRGLHETNLQQWRLQMINSLSKTAGTNKFNRSAADIRHINELEKELKRKDKALAETAALLVLKKKLHQIWGEEDMSIPRRNEK